MSPTVLTPLETPQTELGLRYLSVTRQNRSPINRTYFYSETIDSPLLKPYLLQSPSSKGPPEVLRYTTGVGSFPVILPRFSTLNFLCFLHLGYPEPGPLPTLHSRRTPTPT